MALGRPKAELILTSEQREQLSAMAASRSLAAGLVMRARIILMSAEGQSNLTIATRLRLSQATVGQWRRRFLEQGITGLHDELRPGRPRTISDERVARLVRRTLETKPGNGTHWSIRQIATETRVSKSLLICSLFVCLRPTLCVSSSPCVHLFVEADPTRCVAEMVHR